MIHFLLSLFFIPFALMASLGPIPQDATLLHTSFPNGIQLYSKENEDSQYWACLRVIFRYQGEEHALFSFDSPEEDWEGIDAFLFACANEVRAPGTTQKNRNIPASFSLLANRHPPQQIGIVAVGNVSHELIIEKIEHHFADLTLNRSHEPFVVETAEEIDPAHVAMNLSFPYTRPLVTFEDLVIWWQHLFLQETLQQRFEQCTKRASETWIHPHPQGIYPASGYALSAEDDLKNLLSFFLWHLEMMRNSPICDHSFSVKKQELLYRLSYMDAQKDHPTNPVLASYCADLFLLGASNLDFASFITASLSEVSRLQEEDLLSLIPIWLDKNNQFIHLAYSSHLRRPMITAEDVKEIEEQLSSFSYQEDFKTSSSEDPFSQLTFDSAPILCSYQASNEAPQFVFAAVTPSSFYKLPLNAREQEMITSIITTIAENNIFQLAMHKTTLEKKGKKIDHVHPLRFMGHILSNPTLKNHIKTIRKSSFKWDALISGFSKKMREQMGRNNVYPHLDGFAALVGTTKEQIVPYVQKADFEGLVKSLL